MGVDFESFQDVLKHPIRKKIILALGENQPLSYMDLMRIVDARNTGKFNYHLKVLADLIEKDQNGKYQLTEKGRLAAQFLQTFKEKTLEPTPLKMADATLIGFAGFVVTLINPFLWIFIFFAEDKSQSIPLFESLVALSIVFMWIVPGALMWRLTVKRSHSHDAYDLFKSPFLAMVMLILLLVTMVVLNVNIGATAQVQIGHVIKSGTTTLPNGGTASWGENDYTSLGLNLYIFVGEGLIFSFVGAALSELASRIRKRIAFKR